MKECLYCGAIMKERGFCSTECHDKYYDEYYNGDLV